MSCAEASHQAKAMVGIEVAPNQEDVAEISLKNLVYVLDVSQQGNLSILMLESQLEAARGLSQHTCLKLGVVESLPEE